jgi:hypothetical protein
MAAQWASNVLFCMPSRSKCILLVSVVSLAPACCVGNQL